MRDSQTKTSRRIPLFDVSSPSTDGLCGDVDNLVSCLGELASDTGPRESCSPVILYE